jgi:cephalosporin hydroxylase
MDLFALQEILAELRPELVIQSGGSAGAAFYVAHLLETLRPAAVVLFIDPNPRVAEQLAQIRPPPIRDRVRALFERRIEIIAARATAPELAATLIPRAQGKVTLAMLDSCHNVDHVKRELALLAPLVSLGSYVIVQDTLIDRRPEWISRRASCDGDVRAGGPLLAVQEFLDEHPEFQADRSREKLLTTWNPSGYLRRIR